MKRIKCFAIFLLAITVLSGCGSFDSYLEKKILAKSGIITDQDYKSYREMEDKKQVSAEGVFTDTDLFLETQADIAREGSVHLTFADNRYLELKYYTDPECKSAIDTDHCYLNPGDTVYAVSESKNPCSNLYRLSEFRILQYDKNMNKKKESIQKADSHLVYQIPKSMESGELSILPIGEYPDRKLSLSAFYRDDQGNAKNLASAGRWFINEKECSIDNAKISPIESYSLKFDFDEDNYFFVGTEPDCFTSDPDTAGFVEFWQAKPTDADQVYSVELHPYLSLSILVTDSATIRLGSGAEKKLGKGKSWKSEKLRYGDVILIETGGECRLTSGDYDHVKSEKDPITGANRYTFTIVKEPVEGASQVVSKDEYISVTLPENAEHGSCSYKVDGEIVTESVTLQTGQKLSITYRITDSNYRFHNAGLLSYAQSLLSGKEKTETISITEDMDGSVLNPDEWFEIERKGE